MATILTVTVKGACWKQHGCVACGATYRYLLERKARASGGVGDDVSARAANNLARVLHDDIESVPCPSCGAFQPDMVAKGKTTWHLTMLAIAGVISFALIIPTFMGVLPLDVAGKVAAAIVGLTAIGHLITAIGNPNRKRLHNMRQAQAQMAIGTLQLIHAGDGSVANALPRNLTAAHAMALVLVLLAPLGFLAVVGVSEMHPMPRNVGVNPDVIGPGDEVTVPLPCSIRSFAGHWRGSAATAEVLNTDELGIAATLATATHRQHWGKITHVNNAKHPFEPIKPWIRVWLPEDAKLGGSTIRLKVSVAVSYPTQGGSSNAEKTTTVEKEVSLALAEAGSDALYRQTWNIGKWVGLCGCLLGGFTLYSLGLSLKRRALPHDAISLAAPSDGRIISGSSTGYAIGGLR